ncbi:hypothetical protein K438DRAFT_1782269 [Mycena galopus ATCC 62051]|nr:hypothetical protein K438DRAFT_1782269 [Mycena galopus ATCC 62051]
MAPASNTTGGSASGSAPERTLEERTLANEQSMVNINAQLALILAAMKPDGAPMPIAPVPAPEPQNTPPPLVMPQSQPQFIPPIAPLNAPAAGMHHVGNHTRPGGLGPLQIRQESQGSNPAAPC